MSLAPQLDTIKVKAKTSKTSEQTSLNSSMGTQMTKDKKEKVGDLHLQDIAPDGICDFSVYGAGGAGKVAALRFAVNNNPNNIPVTTIDTSGLSDVYEGVNSIRIGNLSGSGKLRKDNVDHIKDFVASYVEKETFGDVNVIIHSLSGGSGSVIGPMMIDEILRQKKVAIAIVIIDQDSEVDTINALNSLRSLDNIVKSRKGYLPMIIFDNNNGRPTVDRGIDSTMINLSIILSTPLIGLDTKDRLRFFNPSGFDGVTSGVKLLNVSRDEVGNWEKNGQISADDENEGIDSALIISDQSEHRSLSRRCKVTFRGYYPKEGSPLIASVGYTIPEQVIKDLNATIHGHRSAAAKKETKIESEYEIGEQQGGLIL